MTVTLDLPEELADRLRRKAAAEGKKLDDYLRSLAEDAAPPEPAGSDPPHLALALAIAARLPADEVARMPTDGAENLDHYVYGIPKRTGRP